ncbi:MAG: serine/threonine protein kinase, partial [Deltaproteobacteria bacterium]|nr:serine/threonine protein kinase [Deltaproteobacteria bacterium]
MAERLGRYVVLKHLASGGMADVLLARTDGIEGFERHVVLKRIRAEHAKDKHFIDMFLHEARLAANLHHQNIVQVHDIGEASGEYFFAMEYLHGEDLRAMLAKVARSKTHMPLGYVLAIMSAVAAGLHHAHERKGPDKKPLNIVHRDVSPSNVIIGYDGSVKIVDFGIAKAAHGQVETRSGSLKGKVSYMSPEQCKMQQIDRRSDVYSLGVVLYELCTTTRLFKHGSDYLVMDAICTGKIPLPRVRRPDLPNELSTIIMTALSADPGRRYQTADELRGALDQFAIKEGLNVSAGALATYLTKLFGEKPEPWVDLARQKGDTKPPAFADTVANGRSWSEMAAAADDFVEVETRTGGGSTSAPRAEAKTITDGKGNQSRTAQAALEPTQALPPTPTPSRVEDRTSTRMAWEHEGAAPLPAPKRSMQRIAMIAVPLVLLAGVGIWKLTAGGNASEPSPIAASAAATPKVAVTPPPPPPPAVTAIAPEPPAPAPAVVAAAPVREMTVEKKPAKKPDVVKPASPKVVAVKVAEITTPPPVARESTPTATPAPAPPVV